MKWAAAAVLLTAVVALVIWGPVSALWFNYGWPSDKGNGPEAIQQTILYAAIAALVYPPVRKWFKTEHDRIHAKLDHVIKHHPDIPEFKEKP